LKTCLYILGFMLFLFNGKLNAQSGLEISAEGLAGFQSSELTIYQSEVTDYNAYGFRAGVAYTYTFLEGDLETLLWLGYKRLDFTGQHQEKGISGYTQKALLRLGARYHFSDTWATGIFLTGSNNRDTDDFRASTSDNFRFGVEGEVLYRFLPWLGTTLSVHHVMYPTTDIYLVSNAPFHLQLGLNFNIW